MRGKGLGEPLQGEDFYFNRCPLHKAPLWEAGWEKRLSGEKRILFPRRGSFARTKSWGGTVSSPKLHYNGFHNPTGDGAAERGKRLFLFIRSEEVGVWHKGESLRKKSTSKTNANLRPS